MLSSENSIRKTDIVDMSPACRELHIGTRRPSGSSLLDLGIYAAGHGVERVHYEIRRTTHPGHQVLFTLSGEGRVEINGVTHAATAGTAWVCPHGNRQNYGLAGDHWELIWLSLPATHEYWSPLVNARGNGIYPTRWCGPLHAAFRGLHREQHSDAFGAEEACASFARQMAIYLERVLQVPELHAREAQTKVKLLRLFDLVREDLATKWSVEELSELSELHVCPDHFAKHCAKILGKPPLQLVTEMRMRKTADLLVSTDYKLALIADLVGYSTAFALSAAFKRHYGLSPAKYRKKG